MSPRTPLRSADPEAAARSPAGAAARANLTPDDWVQAATAVLVDQGIDRVRVDVLAGQLEVTRGSFYWHFKDREDLLRRVLMAWRDQATVLLTQRLEQAHADPREQLRDVLSLPFRGEPASRAARIELAIRAWARRDAMARQVVEEADGARIGYIAQLLSALGFPLREARQRAFLLYSYVVAESLFSGAVRHGSADRAMFVEQLLLQPIDPAATR